MSAVHNLLQSYKQSLKQAHKMLDRLGETEKDGQDRLIITEMIKDLEYVITWLKLGYDPTAIHGVNKKDAYKVGSDESE